VLTYAGLSRVPVSGINSRSRSRYGKERNDAKNAPVMQFCDEFLNDRIPGESSGNKFNRIGFTPREK